MNIWLAISLILVVASTYMLMIEVFSVAFKLTGLATNKIKFQVASLFTSVGFTTAESELITSNEKRRKIAVTCMYTGHVFSVVFMGLMINMLITIGQSIGTGPKARTFTEWYFIFFYIAVFVFLLCVLLKVPPINSHFQKLLEKIAINASKKNRNSNTVTVLDSYGRSSVTEVILNKVPEYAKDKSLGEMQINKIYAMIILSIRRSNRVVDISKDTMLRKGDRLICYGVTNDIRQAFIDSVNDQVASKVTDSNQNELSLLNNYGSNALMEVGVAEVPKELENIPMKDSHLTDRYSINIIAIKRKDQYLFADKETIIQQGDKITMFGPYKNIKHLFQNDDK